MELFTELRRLTAGLLLVAAWGRPAPAPAADNPHNRFAVKAIQTPAALLGVAYSPDGQRVATCGLGRDIVVWDVESGQPALTLRGHADDVVAVEYSPNGRYIASGGVDKALNLWDALTGELLRTTTDHTDYVRDVAFSPDSRLLASAGWDGQTMVFDTFSGERRATLRAGSPAAGASPAPGYDKAQTTRGRANNVTSVAFSPAGTELLTASGDHALRTWDTATWQLKTTLQGHTDEVWDARYAPNGQYAVSGAWDNTVRFWSLAEQRCVLTMPAHVSDVWAAAFSPDGQLVATGGGDRQVKIWDAALGTLVADLSGALHTAGVENLAFRPDGQRLASVSRDGSLRLWRVPTTDERVLAYADHETETWAKKGDFEKSDDYQKRLVGRYNHLQAMKAEAQTRILAGFGATANWQPFVLGNYNADTEAFALTGSMWPGIYHVRVPRREAPGFRDGFAQRGYGVPTFAFEAGRVVLKSVPVLVAVGGAPHTFTLAR